MNFDGIRERRGGSGRIPDAIVDQHQTFIRRNITLPPDLDERLTKYCEDEERAISWVIQKALASWLEQKGY